MLPVVLLLAAGFTVKGKTTLHAADVHVAIRAMEVRPAAAGGHQLRVAWKTARGRTTPAMTLLSHRYTQDEVPQQRALEMAPDRLLVLGVDSAGAIKFWSVVADPRVLRAEFPGPGGQLSGRTLARPNAELLLDVPDNSEIREVRVYHPVADDLRLEGTLSLPRKR